MKQKTCLADLASVYYSRWLYTLQLYRAGKFQKGDICREKNSSLYLRDFTNFFNTDVFFIFFGKCLFTSSVTQILCFTLSIQSQTIQVSWFWLRSHCLAVTDHFLTVKSAVYLIRKTVLFLRSRSDSLDSNPKSFFHLHCIKYFIETSKAWQQELHSIKNCIIWKHEPNYDGELSKCNFLRS